MRRHIVKKVKVYKSHRFYLPKAASKDDNKKKVTNSVKETEQTNTNNLASAKNKKEKETMNTTEKIEKIQDILQEPQVEKVKKVKRDKSLIERAENTKIVMVDDDKMLLND